eukprot:6108609-Amphidinium_carterae.1
MDLSQRLHGCARHRAPGPATKAARLKTNQAHTTFATFALQTDGAGGERDVPFLSELSKRESIQSLGCLKDHVLIGIIQQLSSLSLLFHDCATADSKLASFLCCIHVK